MTRPWILLLLALATSLVRGVLGQIPVAQDGTYVTLETAPPAASWATRNPGGVKGDITTAAGLEAAAQTNSAALIAAALPTSDGTYNNLACYDANAQLIYLRPTRVAYGVLLATLLNTSGSEQSHLTVSYELATSQPNTEELPGHRVYWSRTGAAGTWNYIGTVGGNTPGIATVAFVLNLGTWSDDEPLYLMWIDDNGSGSPDTLHRMGNFAFTVGLPTPVCTLTAPTNGAFLGRSFPAKAVVQGAVTNVAFYVDGGQHPYGLTAVAPFSITISNLDDGAHTIYAQAADSLGGLAYSAINRFTLANDPLAVALSSPADNQVFLPGQPVILSADLNGGFSPYSVDFYLNGALVASANSAPYSLNLGTVRPGTYTVSASVTDTAAATVTTATTTFLVQQSVSYTGGTWIETFDSMGTNGTVHGTNGLIPPGWWVGWTDHSTPPNQFRTNLVALNDGTLAGLGGVAGFNCGSNTADRSLAVAATGIGVPLAGLTNRFIEVAIRNDSGDPLGSLTVTFDGEQWRSGSPGSSDQLVLEYSLDGINYFNSGVSFVAPVQNVPAGTPLDGHAAENRLAGITATVTLSNAVPAGGFTYFRWSQDSAGTAAPVLGIDNFQFSASPVRPPLQVVRRGGQLVVTWQASGFILQQTSELRGSGATSWTNVAGFPQGSYTNRTPTGSPLFYRLEKQ
jgi:hypothetical protein